MPCYSPRIAQQSNPGTRPVFSNLDFSKPLMTVPCGRCFGCRLMRKQAWVARCMGEAQTAGQHRSFMVTCTYANNPYSLVLRDHTLFMKRLRKKFPGVRFVVGAEYGEKEVSPVTGFGRPHFHYLFFGMDIPDLVPLGSGGKFPYYSSETLTRLWGLGHVNVALFTEQTCGYAVSYILKKRLGPESAEHYSFIHPDTRERVPLVPPFQRQSLKPGIGAEWFAKFHGDVYPRDKFPLKGGRFIKPPPYYDVLYERLAAKDSSLAPLDELKAKRVERTLLQADDFTDARLKVREACAKAKAEFYARKKL